MDSTGRDLSSDIGQRSMRKSPSAKANRVFQKVEETQP